MEFYVFRVRFLKDGTTKKSEIMTYPTLRQAEAKHYSNLGTDMADDTLSGGVGMVISSDASVLTKTKWGQKTIIEEEVTE